MNLKENDTGESLAKQINSKFLSLTYNQILNLSLYLTKKINKFIFLLSQNNDTKIKYHYINLDKILNKNKMNKNLKVVININSLQLFFYFKEKDIRKSKLDNIIEEAIKNITCSNNMEYDLISLKNSLKNTLSSSINNSIKKNN